MDYKIEATPAMEPAQEINVFEQTINTLNPEGKPPATTQPQMSAAAMASPSTPTVQKDDGDATGDRLDQITEPQVTPANGNSKDSQAELMINLAKGFTTLSHTPDGDAYASITVNDHSETVKVRSLDFKQWLGMIFYKEYVKPPSSQAIKDTLAIIEAEAKFDGPEISIHLRYAWHDGSIYIDLCDRSWNQVEISKDGWKVIGSKESPVKFFRAQGMMAMPIPKQGGSIDLLKKYLNVVNDSEWVMIVSWIIGSMKPSGPYPILVLQGEQGTAKSTAARLLRNLIDPSAVPSQSLSRSERDLIIAAIKSWVLNFDNLSYLKPEMADALCRLSTGGGFRTRALYTDDNERLFNSVRPIIINGITDLATRHDLADRSLVVQLSTIPKDKRIAEKELMMNWNFDKDKIFGALCQALSVALLNVYSVKLPSLPRMADFALWVTAAEPALGWEHGTFMREYENNQRSIVEIALEADPIAIAVIRLIKLHTDHEWHGTASDLLVTLGVNQDLIDMKSWPRKPNVLSGRLKRAAPSLREIGIEVDWTKSGDRFIHIVPTPVFKFETRIDGLRKHDVPDIPDLPDVPDVHDIPDLPETTYEGYENEELT